MSNMIESGVAAQLVPTEGLNWYWYQQNNSGGYFFQNDDVDEDVFIQAESKEEAEDIFSLLDNGAESWCECCGERWGMPRKCKGGVPERDGVSILIEYPRYSNAILHFKDGRKVNVPPSYKQETEL